MSMKHINPPEHDIIESPMKKSELASPSRQQSPGPRLTSKALEELVPQDMVDSKSLMITRLLTQNDETAATRNYSPQHQRPSVLLSKPDFKITRHDSSLLSSDSKEKVYSSYHIISKINLNDVKTRTRPSLRPSFSGKQILQKNKLWNEKLKVLEQFLDGGITEANFFNKAMLHIVSPQKPKVDEQQKLISRYIVGSSKEFFNEWKRRKA